MPDGRDTILRDLGRLERWAHTNVVKFNKAKCKILNLGWGNPKHRYGLYREWLKSSPDEKNLEVSVDEKLNTNQQRVVAAQKANCILNSIKRNVTIKIM